MMDNNDKFSQAYIQKIFEIQKNQQERPLSQEELKEIALNLGMTEEDWENLQRTYHDHLERGEGFLRYGNLEDAVKEIEQAVAINPHKIKGLSLLSQIYQVRWQQKGRLEDALKSLHLAEKIIQIEPSHDTSLRLISELKQYPEVQKHLSKRPETHEGITKIAFNTRLYAQIAVGVAILLVLGFGLRNVFSSFSRTYSNESINNYNSNESNYEDNKNNNNNVGTDNSTNNSNLNDNTLNSNPTTAVEYFNNAVAKEEGNDWGGALEDYNQAIKLNPKYADAWMNRGIVQFKLQYFAAAVEDFNRVVLLDPTNPKVYYSRGLAKFNLKDYESAIKDFDKTIQQNPADADAFLNRGTAKYNAGDEKGACTDWNKALDLGNSSAQQNISQYCN